MRRPPTTPFASLPHRPIAADRHEHWGQSDELGHGNWRCTLLTEAGSLYRRVHGIPGRLAPTTVVTWRRFLVRATSHGRLRPTATLTLHQRRALLPPNADRGELCGGHWLVGFPLGGCLLCARCCASGCLRTQSHCFHYTVL